VVPLSSFRRDNLETECVYATGSFNLVWQRRVVAHDGHGGLVRVGEMLCQPRTNASVAPTARHYDRWPPLANCGFRWGGAMRLLALTLALVISAASAAYAEKRVAPVIGNATYKNATLINAKNNATDVSLALKQSSALISMRPAWRTQPSSSSVRPRCRRRPCLLQRPRVAASRHQLSHTGGRGNS
jgi:hypothetical protein